MIDIFVPESTISAKNLFIMSPFFGVLSTELSNFSNCLVSILMEKQIFINISGRSQGGNVPIVNFETFLEKIKFFNDVFPKK